jgi:carboxypeptidase C (cathepsin A)
MEGYYDLATPYLAANYSIDHLSLGPNYRKNVSFTTYEAGHMVYIDSASHVKMKKDLVEFMGKSMR